MSKKKFHRFTSETIIANDVAISIVDSYDVDTYSNVHASGTAVTHPDDKFSFEVAELLSLGRALESLGKKLQKRANGIAKQNEDNRRRKVLAAENAANRGVALRRLLEDGFVHNESKRA